MSVGIVEARLPLVPFGRGESRVAPPGGTTGARVRAAWPLARFCLSEGVDADVARQIEHMLTNRVRLARGRSIYRVGCEFKALYAIRTGACKTVLLTRAGQDQVAGYHIAGDVVGMDGIGSDAHECQAIALEDMDVCPLPFDEIERLTRLCMKFQHNVHRLLSQEGTRARAMMILLGTMRAEQRLGVFLLDLSQRYRERGYSSSEFVLRMTRAEIASYLGLKLETVSRMFSRFQHAGWISVDRRSIRLLDSAAMSRVVEGSTAHLEAVNGHASLAQANLTAVQ
jgi:CRP/FNR family transcriptional regulator